MALIFLNAAIMTVNGTYDMADISLRDVQHLIATTPVVKSYVGHQSTADILTSLLDFTIPMNREEYKHNHDDTVIVFQLNKRGEEGRIYTVEEIEQIGYTLKQVWFGLEP